MICLAPFLLTSGGDDSAHHCHVSYSVSERPPNYLALSIFSCLCCWLLGIIAIFYSLQVRNYVRIGQANGQNVWYAYILYMLSTMKFVEGWSV